MMPDVNPKPANQPVLKNFSDFGTFGDFPPMPICDSCGLEFDCSNYSYQDVDDKNMNVCRKCKNDLFTKNYNDLSKPLYVYARSVGKPRQCRLLN